MADRELAVREPADLRLQFVAPLQLLKEQVDELEAFKKSIMVAGTDYGTIPGTVRPTLLKPGAEKLALAFGLTPRFSMSKIEDWVAGFFYYECTCELISRRTGEPVANAIGSANSKEPRYRWRDQKPACPECGGDLRRSKHADKPGEEPGWYCWARMGGCGGQFPKSAATGGRVENTEPYELVNTLQKMSQKRALVAAVLLATGGSSIWTQDIEDLSDVEPELDIESGPPGDGEVIDVGPRAAAVGKRGPGRPAKPKPAIEELIQNADDTLWKRWLEIKDEARALGVHVDELRLPLTKAALVNAGLVVRSKIKQRRDQLQQEEAARAAGARARVTGTATDENTSFPTRQAETPAPEKATQAGSPGTGGSPAWERNRGLVDEAYALGLRPATLRNTATPAEIEQANADLEVQIERYREVLKRAAARRGAG